MAVEPLASELNALVASFANPHLKGLLEAILAEPDIALRYRRAPATKQMLPASREIIPSRMTILLFLFLNPD